MAKVARLCSSLIVLAIALGTLACEKQAVSTNSTSTNAQGAVDPEAKRNQHKATIAELDRSIQQNPKDAEAYNKRGQAHFSLGDRILQASDGQEAIQTDLKHLQAALTDFDRAIKLQPNKAIAHQNRGLVNFTLHDRLMRPLYESDIFRRTSDGAKDDAYYIQAAIADSSQAIQLQPDNADAYINRANAYIRAGKTQQAAADFDRAIQLQPNNATAYRARGIATFTTGDLYPGDAKVIAQKVMADLDRAIQLNPNYAEAYVDRANVRLNTSTISVKKEVIADYRKAIELYRQQGNPQAWLEEQVASLEEKLK